MAGLNFYIGTTQGLTAEITGGLVGGMHADQLHGHPSIAENSRSVSESHSNKSSARIPDDGMMRAPLAIRDTPTALSAAALDQGFAASVQVLASARLFSNERDRR